MTAKRKKPRPVLERNDYSEAAIHADIKVKVGNASPLRQYLTQVQQEDVFGSNEFDRGLVEGMRRLARQLMDIADSTEV